MVVSFETRQISYTCFSSADLAFQIPNPTFTHTPVQIDLVMGSWNEEYAKDAVVGEYFLVYQNLYNRTYASAILTEGSLSC